MKRLPIGEPNKGSISWLLNTVPQQIEVEPCAAAKAQVVFTSFVPLVQAESCLQSNIVLGASFPSLSVIATAPMNTSGMASVLNSSLDQKLLSRKRTSEDVMLPSRSASSEASASTTPLSHSLANNSIDRSSTASPSSSSHNEGSEDGDRRNQSIALNSATAVDIYQKRPRDAGTKYGSMACAAQLAAAYDVSPKTIRDIWNRKSWVKATKPMWTEEEKRNHIPRSHRPRDDDKCERRSKSRRLDV